ncbi:alpha/beta hydrolase [Sphaerisporangium sp. TRM90804]|uniref:alpha/beta hydrolase n=1 Tax=Sphaerisporangium sp. TRM90804 TaxID=3031113 RepID=UPI0024485327|nr:alpha/beta hydrolase [Sphaerisporangium sp. TRM90804]MDH2430190.1 alpha/beta hydrolase [Sphaerisporangium sp. TRM90804]
MRRTVATLAIAGVGLSVLTGALPANAAQARVAAKPAVTAAPSTVTWAPCTGGLEGLECAKIPVPLDYSKPTGQKISIAVSRKKHTVSEADYQGILLMNPGGPGGSGLSAPGWFEGSVAQEASGAYDLIGFDPRGVGQSEPRLVCGSSYGQPVRPDYVPANAAEERAWLARAKDFSAKCGAAFGRLLKHMKTVDSARDLDTIRQALGQRKINYFGYSWGTYLGATYATLFPNKVRRFVLDSVVRPSGVWYEANLDQDRAFEVRAKDFFAWTAKYDSVYHLGTTGAAVEKKYYELRAKLKASPAQDRVGPSELDDTYLVGGYTNSVWIPLATGLSQAAQGSDDFLVTLYDAFAASDDDSGHALYLATSCTDARWPKNWDRWRRDNWATYRTAPFLTWGNAWFNAPCITWPAKAGTPLPISGKGLPPVLLFQATKDAATPYPGAVEMHKLLPSSRLIVENGGGNHGISLSGNECLDAHLSAYLTDGTVPAQRRGVDATCAPLPDPVPSDGVTTRSAPALPDIRVRR